MPQSLIGWFSSCLFALTDIHSPPSFFFVKIRLFYPKISVFSFLLFSCFDFECFKLIANLQYLSFRLFHCIEQTDYFQYLIQIQEANQAGHLQFSEPFPDYNIFNYFKVEFHCFTATEANYKIHFYCFSQCASHLAFTGTKEPHLH